MRGRSQRTAGFQIGRYSAVVPVRKVGDEVQQAQSENAHVGWLIRIERQRSRRRSLPNVLGSRATGRVRFRLALHSASDADRRAAIPDAARAANALMCLTAASRNACGQSGSAGSGHSDAQITRGKPPADAAPTKCAASKCAHAESTSPAALRRNPSDRQIDFDQPLRVLQ